MDACISPAVTYTQVGVFNLGSKMSTSLVTTLRQYRVPLLDVAADEIEKLIGFLPAGAQAYMLNQEGFEFKEIHEQFGLGSTAASTRACAWSWAKDHEMPYPPEPFPELEPLTDEEISLLDPDSLDLLVRFRMRAYLMEQ